MQHRSTRSSTAPVAPRPNSLRTLPQRTYRFRALGMGLAALPIAAVLHERDASAWAWSWMLLTCLAWPHLAYVIARRSRDPFVAELRNFVADSLFAGSWVPLMHFNLLASVLLVTVVTADKINSGIRGLWLRSLPGMAAAILAGGALTGFVLQPESTRLVVLACLPILVIHTLAVSLSTYRLIRRVQRQNLQLEELSRRDGLTGLDARRHWETLATALLHARHPARAASLMLVDVDRFKQINDRYGHGAGDDVLRAIAAAILEHLPPGAHAGRLGGDEFVVAMPLALTDARSAAERLLEASRAMRFDRHPSLHCTVSIGLADPSPDTKLLRDWLERADRALYAAKRAGRDRIAMPPPAAYGSNDAAAPD